MISALLVTAFILANVLTSAVVSVYGSGVALVTFAGFDIPGALLPLFALPFVMLVTASAFAVCRFTDRHHLAGTFVTVAYLFITMRIVGSLSSMGRRASGIYFREWMLTRGDEIGITEAYFAALIISSCVFFGITVYYFSLVQYNTAFLTLVSLMPFVLYAKIIAETENFYIILVAASNVAVHMTRAKFDRRKRNMYISRPETLASHALFAAAMLFVVALLPKDDRAPFYDRFEDVFLGGDTSSALSGDYSSLSEFSGKSSHNAGGGNRRMYALYGDTYTYLKRQNYDYYDFEMHRWYADDELNAPVTDPRSHMDDAMLLSLDNLQKTVIFAIRADEKFAEKYALLENSVTNTVDDRMRVMRVISENFGAVYYLSASRGVTVDADMDYRVTDAGNFYITDGTHGKNAEYDLSFYDTPSILSSWLMTGLANFSDDEAFEMLDALSLTAAGNPDHTSYIDAFRKDLENAVAYKEKTAANTALIPDEIKELALEITADCRFDWQKAKAIEDYFQKSDFVYDLEYRAPDPRTEYFLFESRTGTCSDFATAFTLLARAAGLCVRYTEGYMPEYSSREGSYIVRERDSHAFPEVFLQNTGWVVFEPTVSAVGSLAQEESFIDYITQMRVDLGLAGSLLIALFAVIMLIMFVKLILPAVFEAIFRLRLLVESPARSMPAAYRRLLVKATPKHLLRRSRSADKRYPPPRTDALTMREFGMKLKEEGCDITDFLYALEVMRFAEGERRHLASPLEGEVPRRGGEGVAPTSRAQVLRTYTAAAGLLRKKQKTLRLFPLTK